MRQAREWQVEGLGGGELGPSGSPGLGAQLRSPVLLRSLGVARPAGLGSDAGSQRPERGASMGGR